MIFTMPKLFCLQVAGPPEFLKCHATDPIPTRPPRQRSASSFTESVAKYVPKESQEQRPTSTGKSWILVSSATYLGARFGLYSPETNWSGSGKLDLLESFSSFSICHEW